MPRTFFAPSLCIALAATAACRSPEAPTAAHVRFRLVSPFCGPQKFGLHFMVDQTMVGFDSLSTAQMSESFSTTPGSHLLRGTVTGWIVTGDTTVVLQADSTFTTVVNIYCS